MDSSTHIPQLRQPSAGNIIRGMAWSFGGAAMIGALGGATYGTLIFPVYGTIVGGAVGAIIGAAASMVLGPAMTAAALIAPTPTSRIRQTSIVGAVGSVLLSIIVAIAVGLIYGQAWAVAVTLLPTTAGAAWTGGFVARSTLDQTTSAEIKNYGVKVHHVMQISVLTAVLTWLTIWLSETM